MTNTLTSKWPHKTVYLFALLVSVLLSFFIDHREVVINPDAICYLLSAQSISSLGIKGAMHLCGQAGWPFYPILIHAFVSVTHLTYANAAYTLDAFFSAMSVLLFINIVATLGGSVRVQWLAAIVILLAHQFNSVREYIVRDHGFWAFYLASLLLLLLYFRKPRLTLAVLWSISLAIATLFRIEGAVFLLLLPILCFLPQPLRLGQRVKCFISLNLLTILVVIMLGGWLLMHPAAKMGRLAEVIDQLHHGFIFMAERYQTTKAALAQHVLTTDSAHDAGLILVLVLLAWYGVSVIMNVSLIYAILVVYAWCRRSMPNWQDKLILAGYLIINVAITLGFLLEHLFLSKRYLMALSLVLMLWVPFALQDLLTRANSMRAIRYRWYTGFAALGIFIMALGGIVDFGYSKAYLRNAGDWLAANVPANASLYVNDYQLMYYSQHFGYQIFTKMHEHIDTIAHGQWKQYDYVALRVGKPENNNLTALMQEIHLSPIQVFSNRRGDKVVIFRSKQS